MKLIQQFRYYGNDSDQNYPRNIMTEANLTNHNIANTAANIKNV